MKLPVYLDHHATTPLDPRVLDAMLPYLTGEFGNAASLSHRFGWVAEKAVEAARQQVAALAGASPREIVFTSGATESINLALKGAAEAHRGAGNHIVTLATEHRAVLDTCQALARRGFEISVLPVEEDGRVRVEAVAAALRPATLLVSVLWANNEIGVLQPVAEIGALCAERGVLFHVDAVQAFGKIPVDVEAARISLMSVSAHKIYGPKGVGALYLRRKPRRVALQPQIDGGGHEGGLRSGTLNVAGIVGLGAACALCGAGMAAEAEYTRRLRDRLLAALTAGIEGVQVNGSLKHRLPNNLNASFSGVDSEALLTAVSDVALSTGSACTSATIAPSHVLRALGMDDQRAHSAVRFGIGRSTTAEEIDYAAGRLVEAVARLRRLSPLNK